MSTCYRMEWTKLEIRDAQGNGVDLFMCEDLIMPEMFTKMKPEVKLNMIRDLKYKKDDVFVASYPKTGTHWVANLLHFLKTDVAVESLSTVSPVLVELTPTEMWEKAENTSIVSSHLLPNRVPCQHIEKRGKIIVVARDPRDAAVSMFHHIRSQPDFKCPELSWNCFVEAYIRGDVPFGSFFDYYNKWLNFIQDNKLDALYVFFEDLKVDGLKELQRMQEFLGISHSTERLQKILDRCSVKSLKSEVESGAVKSPLVDAEGKSYLYRKGDVGDWKNYFTVAQSEHIESVIKDKFQDTVFERYNYNKKFPVNKI